MVAPSSGNRSAAPPEGTKQQRRGRQPERRSVHNERTVMWPSREHPARLLWPAERGCGLMYLRDTADVIRVGLNSDEL